MDQRSVFGTETGMSNLLGQHERVSREYCASHGIHYCEESKPFPWRTRAGEAYHPDAHVIPDSECRPWDPEDVVIMKCPHCGLSAGVPKLAQAMRTAEE